MISSIIIVINRCDKIYLNSFECFILYTYVFCRIDYNCVNIL